MPRMLSGRGGMARFQIALFSSRHCFSTWPLVLKFSTFQPERVYNGLRIISKLFIVGSLTNLSYFAESGVWGACIQTSQLQLLLPSTVSLIVSPLVVNLEILTNKNQFVSNFRLESCYGRVWRKAFLDWCVSSGFDNLSSTGWLFATSSWIFILRKILACTVILCFECLFNNLFMLQSFFKQLIYRCSFTSASASFSLVFKEKGNLASQFNSCQRSKGNSCSTRPSPGSTTHTGTSNLQDHYWPVVSDLNVNVLWYN